MEYIKYALEKATCNDLIVERLFTFLQEVALQNRTEHDGFISRWQDKLHNSTHGIVLCYIKGCWMPKGCDQTEIRKQQSWISFCEKYVANFSGSSIGRYESRSFQPSRLEDLPKLFFFKEIYEVYGSQVMSFIFDKCLILLPLGECFYNCVGYKGSFLQKKICGEMEISGVYKIYRRAKTKHQTPNSPPILRKVEDTCLASKKIFKNPYNFSLEDMRDDSISEERKKCDNINSRCPRKRGRKRKMVEEKHEQVSPKKYRKLCSSSDDKPLSVQKVSDSSSTSKLRWITPNEENIKRILEDREQLKKLNNISTLPSVNSIESRLITIVGKSAQEPNRPTFINIMDDKYFKGKLNFITKELHPIIPSDGTFNSIPNLKGLKLPPTLAQKSERIEIVVHRISETAARKYKLNVKKRKRRHQKKSPMRCSTLTNISNCCQDANTSPTAISSPNQQFSWQPFDPTITLSTVGILFRRSSYLTWPVRSHMNTVCSKDVEIGRGVNFLFKAILDYPVSSSANVIGCNGIQMLISDGKLAQFKTIVEKVLVFHRRIMDTNKLVRNCVKFWDMKHDQIQMEKGRRKLERKEARILKRAAVIPVIDLTENTPSDITTFSPNTNSLNMKSSDSFNSGIDPNQVPNALEVSGTSSHLNDSKTSNKSFVVVCNAKPKSFNRLREKSDHSSIISTLSQILHLNGGIELLGSNSNRKAFFGFLRKSIFMGGVKSCLHFGELMSLINPNKCQWLDLLDDFTLKTHLAAKVVAWIFFEYILNILRMGFYVTDISNSRMQLVFYLRENWRSVSDRIKHQYLKEGKLSQVKSSKEGSSLLPTSKIRFIPKKNNDVRPILSLSREVKSRIDLPQCNLLLNWMVKLAPHAVLDGSAFRDIWVTFLKNWNSHNCPKLYFVRVDIRDAFPSVSIPKLKEILKEAREVQLVIKKLLIIGGGKNPIKQILASRYETNWFNFVLNRPCIIQDTNEDAPFDTDMVLSKILSILDSNIIRIGKQTFEFKNGLPQGWSLSQALCNVYYGHMDNNCFKEFLNKKVEFFVRTVDDYFYISPNPHRISSFFRRMMNGVPEYNCSINQDKSISNIYVQSNHRVERHESVPFCGWRFCITNGHVTRDFTSYADQDICSTLTFNLHNVETPESFIHNRMGMITPARLKYILLDPRINCRERILTSIFEAGLMFAFRFYAICRVVYPNLNTVSESSRVEQLLKALTWCATKLNRYIQRSNAHMCTVSNYKPLHNCSEKESCCGLKMVLENGDKRISKKDGKGNIPPNRTEPISELEIFFVIYNAFSIKLRKHFNVSKGGLLCGILKKRRKEEKKLGSLHANYLLDTVGRTMPEYFKKIKI